MHIADHGNREFGQKSTEGYSSLVEKVSIDDVVSAFRENKIVYVPIAVRGSSVNAGNPHSESARRALLRQAREIKAKAPENSRDVQLTYDESSPTLEERGQRERILAALEFALDVSTDAQNRASGDVLCKRMPSDPRCAAS